MDTDFPIKLLQKDHNYPWLLLFAIIVAGGLLGFAAGFFLKPVYEAQAKLTTNMDIKENRPIITELMIDTQLLHVGELLYHPEIVQKLLDQNSALGEALTLQDLHTMAAIERQGMITLIKIRSRDPQRAAQIANAWGEIAYKRLEEAKPHAIRATEARQIIAMLNYCFPTTPDEFPSDGPSPDTVQFCKGLNFAEADALLKEANLTLIEEDSKSLGLSDSLNLSAFTPSPVPSKPSQFGQGVLSFSGALAALVLGIIGINLLDKKRFS